MKKYFLYKHTFPNGKVYIGITSRSDPEQRWLKGRGYQTQTLMYNAIKFYGWDNIKHEILFSNVEESEISILEQKMIAKYQSNNPEYGYNILNGGMDGFNREGHAVIMYSLEGQYLRIFPTVLDACDYLGVDKGGSIAAACQGKRKSIYGYQWRYYNENFPLQIPAISYEKVMGKKKRVVQIAQDGVVIAEYDSIAKAAQVTNVSAPDIGKVCRGQRKSAGGFIWHYLDV